MTDARYIRNFSIVAHIDHGKSTLADRVLEITGALSKREMADQVLDSMDLERERGITIKAHAVRLHYRARDGNQYQLNLIDTPGHVDFSYEVSRSLSACEGAVLVIDASQGVEAQTLANAQLALNNNLAIIPVINKIDLPGADVEATKQQIEHALALDPSESLLISAKQGLGVDEVLEAIVARVPAPRGLPEEPLRALIFDSWFDSYRGVVVLSRIFEGALTVGMRIRLWSNNQVYTVEELGVLTPKPVRVERLEAGEVGFVIANIKRISDTRIGDTITDDTRPAAAPFPGFEEIKPMVFAGLYPWPPAVTNRCATRSRSCASMTPRFSTSRRTPRLWASASAVVSSGCCTWKSSKSAWSANSIFDLITTAPSVRYRVTTKLGEVLEVHTPTKFPPAGDIEKVEEPIIRARIFTQDEYLGGILKLLEEKRGVQKGFEYVSQKRVLLTYELPLNEIVLDFYDRLKSVSRGYASLDYHFAGFWGSDLVKVDLLVAGEPVDALSFISHRDQAFARGRVLCAKMRKLIPRQLFEAHFRLPSVAEGGRESAIMQVCGEQRKFRWRRAPLHRQGRKRSGPSKHTGW